MADFTYEFPDRDSFIYTLGEYLTSTGNLKLASLLMNVKCSFVESGEFSRTRWDSYKATLCLIVPMERLDHFDESSKKAILTAADSIFPKEAGYQIVSIKVSPHLIPPPDEERILNNTASTVSQGKIEYDGLYFRSKTETKIYDALRRRNVLFFANATAVLGGKNGKREPDFLVCQDGNWGILEVMGEQYHPSSTAMKDHDRARLFKDYGLMFVEFYDASKCYNEPEKVVDDFLKRLSKL